MGMDYTDGVELHKRRVAYHNTLSLALQQQESRIWDLCEEHNLDAEGMSFDSIAATTMTKITSKLQKTPHVDMGHERRWLQSANYVWSPTPLDKFDKTTVLTDVNSSYIRAGKAAANRTKDEVCIDAMLANVKTGMDSPGDNADIVFPTTQVINVRAGSALWDPANPDTTGSAVGFNGKKLKLIKVRFMANEAPQDEQINIAVNSVGFEHLMDDPEISNKDYFLGEFNDKGKVSALGYNFVHTEAIRTDVDGHLRIPAWQKSGVRRAVTSELDTRLSELPDQNYAMQVWAGMGVGAGRGDEGQVIEIKVKV